MKLAWYTDLHLNFLGGGNIGRFATGVERFFKEADGPGDALLLGGDLGEANSVLNFLRCFESLGKPAYFVLGNHDFYRGSIESVRRAAGQLARESENLVYLSEVGAIRLTDSTCLIGHDAWGDARLGDFSRSGVELNDFFLISELVGREPLALRRKLEELGDEAAEHLRKVLPEALAKYSRIIVLLHVPPFKEACWHQGQISNDEWLPFFSCRAAGEVLLQAMRRHPEKQMTVLCGHTHSPGEARLLPNLEVWTGGARYGEPKLQRIIEC